MAVEVKKLFFPNKAIRNQNKAFFAGRRELLIKACDRVGLDEFSAVIYGDRGVGKTSFGWQMLDLLSGNRSLFESEDQQQYLTSINRVPQCKCIWLQCQSYMKNIEGVLLSLVKESSKQNSFSSEFPKVYQSELFRQRIQQKYKINLGVISIEYLLTGNDAQKDTKGFKTETYKSQSREAVIRDVFEDVLNACKAESKDQSIVIFLDEFDSLPERSGVGQLIKAMDDVRFVIIGIADNIDEIIEDHLSADRKLTDSKYRIPRLVDHEINSIFEQAEIIANGELLFDQEFREQVFFKSYGYPYLVQQFGYFSTQASLKYSEIDGKPLIVGVQSLRESIDMIFKDKENNNRFKNLVQILHGQSEAKREVLKIVSKNVDYLSIEKMRNLITETRLKQHLETNVRSLIQSNILKSVGNLDDVNSVRFQDPEARILTQLYFNHV